MRSGNSDSIIEQSHTDLATMSVIVEELNATRAADWDNLNRDSVEGSLFHTLRWKRLLEKSFSFVSRYLMLYCDSKPVGLCPFFEAKYYGFRGLVALPEATLNPRDHLVVRAKECPLAESLAALQRTARREGLSFLAFGVTEEQRKPLSTLGPPIMRTTGRMTLDLSENPPDVIWKARFSNNQRNKVRRFDRERFTLDQVESFDDIATFHLHYAANMCRIGVRPYPLSFFERLVSSYSEGSSDRVLMTLLRKGESVAGGILALYWDAGKIFYWRYFALNRSLPNRYTPFYYLLWHAVKDAHKMGCATVDFGGTEADPAEIHFRMKSHFGCVYVPRYRVIVPISRMAKLLLAIENNLPIIPFAPHASTVSQNAMTQPQQVDWLT